MLAKYSNPDVCKLPQQWRNKIVFSIKLNWPSLLTCQRKVEFNDEDNMPKSWRIGLWDICLHSWDLIQKFLKWFKFSSTLQSILRVWCSSIPSYCIRQCAYIGSILIFLKPIQKSCTSVGSLLFMTHGMPIRGRRCPTEKRVIWISI